MSGGKPLRQMRNENGWHGWPTSKSDTRRSKTCCHAAFPPKRLANNLPCQCERSIAGKNEKGVRRTSLHTPNALTNQERYEQIKELRLHGLSQKEIAQRLAIGVRTVQRWQGLETTQVNPPRRKRRSIFDPYAAYVLSRWQQ